MSFAIYSDPLHKDAPSNELCQWVADFKTSEECYKPHLLNLLTCLSATSSTTSSTTQTVQRLIDLHNELLRFLFEGFKTDGFMRWLEKAIPVYTVFVEQFHLDQDMIEMEIQLMKQPLIRINQIYKHLKTLKGLAQVNETSLIRVKRLLAAAKDKNEHENLSLDLNDFWFGDVVELECVQDGNGCLGPALTLQYFRVEDIVKRDYFEFRLIHPTGMFNDFQIVELLQLRFDQVAICSMKQRGGRSLMFPLIKLNEFELEQNDQSMIHLSKYVNDYKVELILQCPEAKQMIQWNKIIEQLNKVQPSFNKKFQSLEGLKDGKVGCGFRFETSKSLLKKSSPIISRHDSLIESIDSSRPFLSDISNHIALAVSDEHTPVGKSSHSPNFSMAQQAQKSPNPSIHTFSKSEKNLNLNETFNNSTSDLQERFDKYKTPLEFEKTKTVKKRKSVFNIFKKSSEPNFDIVVKKPSATSLKSSNISSPSLNPPSKNSIASSNTPQKTDGTMKPNESMASLNRNVKTLRINTLIGKDPAKPALPSPFSSTPTTATSKVLSPEEEVLLAQSNVIKVIKSSIIVSKWSSKSYKWEIIGSESMGQNILKFLNHESTKEFLMTVHSTNTVIPHLIIPLTNKVTQITKSNTKDLQIRCLESLSSSDPITITIRCSNVSTMNEIRNQVEQIKSFSDKKSDLKVSDSYNSEIFDSEKPSSSTSMSSVSLLQDDIASLGGPSMLNKGSRIYGLTGDSFSTLSLESVTTPTSAVSNASSMHLQNLLLKKDIKIKLHKLDDDEEWIPVSFGMFSIYSNLTNPEYSKFEILFSHELETEGNKMDVLIKNSNCYRIGKSGIVFHSIDEHKGDELLHLIEFRNSKECAGIYELLA